MDATKYLTEPEAIFISLKSKVEGLRSKAGEGRKIYDLRYQICDIRCRFNISHIKRRISNVGYQVRMVGLKVPFDYTQLAKGGGCLVSGGISEQRGARVRCKVLGFRLRGGTGCLTAVAYHYTATALACDCG